MRFLVSRAAFALGAIVLALALCAPPAFAAARGSSHHASAASASSARWAHQMFIVGERTT